MDPAESAPPPAPADVPLPPSRDSLDLAPDDRHAAALTNGQPSLAPLEEEEHESHAANGSSEAHHEQPGAGGEEDERIRSLQEELERTRGEKEAFEAQYRSLLGKLTAMRNTLGDKLKQDADELDRREQEINDLQATNEDLNVTIETLKSELIQSHEDADHVHSELEQLRLRAFDSQKATSEEASSREMALRDAQEDLERVRNEREEWESEAMRERVKREELVTRVGQLEMELGTVKTEREVLREDLERETESVNNLHTVLEEFQAAKERELQSTLGDLEDQLAASNESLAEYKQRASTAENQLAAAQNDSEKVLTLTKEVKDKNLLIGKLRHEAVILNEHLTEALRRLKKDSNENSVDRVHRLPRRLVSNVLISFLNTPRADTKRFEMLQLISSILSWTDDQREQVGLQRSSGLSAPGVIASGSRGGGKGHSRSGKGKAVDDGLGENENFSQLWVEFLLKEATANNATPATSTPPPSSPPTSPSPPAPLSPNGSNTRFNFSDLPPILSPILSPTPSGTSTRRPSFTSFSSSTVASSAPTAPSSISEAEES
ncbi:Golgi matrix protein [Pseudohyphozyma bogoriensis]|nr:Golgi matrix protein [Pseudohyphozyma bogoriensis]